jgi:actin-like ATPase involved in cell morphogenesis
MTLEKNSKKREKELEEAAAQIMSHQSRNSEDSYSETAADGNPMGIDIGTSKIVLAEPSGMRQKFTSMTNAFITVQNSKFTKGILKQNRINHYVSGDSLVVYGDGAEVFGNMLSSETRRPMRHGVLNPKESSAIDIIKGIIDDLVPDAPKEGANLCFSIPGAAQDSETSIIYHEAVLKRHLDNKGYNARSINEGLAVVFSELENENFTGIGISAGGGMCNVCLAFLSVPVFSFSILKGGDYIDDSVVSVTGEVSTRVRHIKEEELDLRREPKNEIEDALCIYYDDLIKTLVQSLKAAVNKTSKIPKMEKPIPIILSGGTAKPAGFLERFDAFMKKEKFPLDISSIRLAEDPLNATAKGALIAAMSEE